MTSEQIFDAPEMELKYFGSLVKLYCQCPFEQLDWVLRRLARVVYSPDEMVRYIGQDPITVTCRALVIDQMKRWGYGLREDYPLVMQILDFETLSRWEALTNYYFGDAFSLVVGVKPVECEQSAQVSLDGAQSTALHGSYFFVPSAPGVRGRVGPLAVGPDWFGLWRQRSDGEGRFCSLLDLDFFLEILSREDRRNILNGEELDDAVVSESKAAVDASAGLFYARDLLQRYPAACRKGSWQSCDRIEVFQ